MFHTLAIGKKHKHNMVIIALLRRKMQQNSRRIFIANGQNPPNLSNILLINEDEAESKNLFEVSIVKRVQLWYNIRNTSTKVRVCYER